MQRRTFEKKEIVYDPKIEESGLLVQNIGSGFVCIRNDKILLLTHRTYHVVHMAVNSARVLGVHGMLRLVAHATVHV